MLNVTLKTDIVKALLVLYPHHLQHLQHFAFFPLHFIEGSLCFL